MKFSLPLLLVTGAQAGPNDNDTYEAQACNTTHSNVTVKLLDSYTDTPNFCVENDVCGGHCGFGNCPGKDDLPGGAVCEQQEDNEWQCVQQECTEDYGTGESASLRSGDVTASLRSGDVTGDVSGAGDVLKAAGEAGEDSVTIGSTDETDSLTDAEALENGDDNNNGLSFEADTSAGDLAAEKEKKQNGALNTDQGTSENKAETTSILSGNVGIIAAVGVIAAIALLVGAVLFSKSKKKDQMDNGDYQYNPETTMPMSSAVPSNEYSAYSNSFAMAPNSSFSHMEKGQCNSLVSGMSVSQASENFSSMSSGAAPSDNQDGSEYANSEYEESDFGAGPESEFEASEFGAGSEYEESDFGAGPESEFEASDFTDLESMTSGQSEVTGMSSMTEDFGATSFSEQESTFSNDESAFTQSVFSEENSVFSENDSIVSEENSEYLEQSSVFSEQSSCLSEGNSEYSEGESEYSEHASEYSEDYSHYSESNSQISEEDNSELSFFSDNEQSL